MPCACTFSGGWDTALATYGWEAQRPGPRLVSADPRIQDSLKGQVVMGAQLGPVSASFSSSFLNSGVGLASGVPATMDRRCHDACWEA